MMIIDETIPSEIISCIDNLKNDYNFDNYNSKGSNGYVFLGENKITKKRIAIKFYYYGVDCHEEVELVSKIRHKNILEIKDARTIEKGWAYFITDEMSYGDLDKLIVDNSLGLMDSINIISNLLYGLSELHSQKNRLLHRDLKLANILIDSNKNPVIADFGSIKRIPENMDFINGSKHAALYRPPESYKESKYYISSDIYQIGLVFYQLLGGFLPYAPLLLMNDSEKKKYNKITNDFDKSKFEDNVIFNLAKRNCLINLDSLPEYIDDNIKRIIKKSTNCDLSIRYKDTADFICDIHKIGQLPNWIKLNDIISIKNYKGYDYQIEKRKMYFSCQRKKENSGNWRQISKIKEGTIIEVIKQLKDILK